MAGTRPVLVTTSIIVHVPEDTKEDFTFVEPFGNKLKDAIEVAFSHIPEVEYPAVTKFDPIWIEEANVGHCCECGCWVTDYTLPGELAGISGGRLIDGNWLCSECSDFQ